MTTKQIYWVIVIVIAAGVLLSLLQYRQMKANRDKQEEILQQFKTIENSLKSSSGKIDSMNKLYLDTMQQK